MRWRLAVGSATGVVLVVLTARNEATEGQKRLRRALGEIPTGTVRRMEVPLLSEAAVSLLAAQAGLDATARVPGDRGQCLLHQ